MAIKKNGSRNSDRVKMRKMHREGYAVDQIASKLSVTEEHVNYVLEKWDAEEENWKERERVRQMEERQKHIDFMSKPANAPLNPEVEALRARIAELEKGIEEKPKPRRRKVQEEVQDDLPFDEENEDAA